MSTLKVLLIGEYPPPYAGIAVQTKYLHELFSSNGITNEILATLPSKYGRNSKLGRIRYLRGIVSLIIYVMQLPRIRRFTVIHILSSSGLNFYIHTLPALVTAKMLGKATIIHYHGGQAESFFSTRKWLFNFSVYLADRLIVPSGFLEDVFINLGAKPLVIPNVIDLSKLVFRERNVIHPILLSARNLTTTYNIACAIRAFKHIKDRFCEAQMIIAGEGPELDYLIKLSKELNLHNSIKFEGNVDNDRMIDLYNRADILINTSNIDNMPISILEAQAMGLLVISTRAGGVPYIIRHNTTGLLADLDNDDEIANNIIYAIENQSHSLSMIEASRIQVATFDKHLILQQWKNLYAQF